MTRAEIEARNYDLKAVNPNAKAEEDTRTPAELLDLIEAKNKEIAGILEELRSVAGDGGGVAARPRRGSGRRRSPRSRPPRRALK